MSATPAQRKATNKYLQNFDDLRIRVPLGDKERIVTHARSQGLSLNAYILQLIEKDLEGNAL